MSFKISKAGKFWQERFGSPECARNYHYYAYELLVDLSFLPSSLGEFDAWHHGSKLLEEVSKRLKDLGWEGTGQFQMLWLPPFVGAGPQDNFGCYALHVKRTNEGISRIAWPVVLPFQPLFQPESAIYPPTDPKDHLQHRQRKWMVRWLRGLFK